MEGMRRVRVDDEAGIRAAALPAASAFFIASTVSSGMPVS
jgi:hypothetical protein